MTYLDTTSQTNKLTTQTWSAYPLTPKGDLHLFPLYNIILESNIMVMKMEELFKTSTSL